MQNLHKRLLSKIAGKKAIIWDFDGVLYFMDWHYGEDLDVWCDKLWQLLEEYDPEVRKKFKSGLKYPYEHSDYISHQYGKIAMQKINDFYREKELSILPVSPMNTNLINLINDLDSGIEHYIWSNNQQAMISKALEKAHVSNKFKAIISRDKVELAKPNLHGFKIIQSQTKIPVEDFLFVGDSLNTDKLVAQQLNMDFFYYKD